MGSGSVDRIFISIWAFDCGTTLEWGGYVLAGVGGARLVGGGLLGKRVWFRPYLLLRVSFELCYP